MTPCQFADLAAVVALHSEELAVGQGPDAAKLHRVWKRTLECFDHWRCQLDRAASPSLYAEIFSAELPVRVWCAAVSQTLHDRGRAAAIAAKINTELLELRCDVLQALAADRGLFPSEAPAVDRFRRRCERWCDVLLGPVAARTGIAECAICPDRALEFGDRFTADPAGRAGWQLVLAGLRIAFSDANSFRGSVRNDENRIADMASALLATFPAAAFASGGTLREPLVGRLCRVQQESVPPKRSFRPKKPSIGLPPGHQPPAPLPPPLAPHHPISFSRLRKRSPKQ